MALTITKVASYVAGDGRTVVFDATFDSRYASGGESLTPVDMGLDYELRSVVAAPAGGRVFQYDYGREKLVAFEVPEMDGDRASAQPLAEVVADTDLSRVTTRVVATGKGPGL